VFVGPFERAADWLPEPVIVGVIISPSESTDTIQSPVFANVSPVAVTVRVA